ncbi:MAG: hypothetical protein WDO73_23545 [Ignavibacteriota bacterium]
MSGTNSWGHQRTADGRHQVADGYGKIVEGTLIGSNLGSGIAAHTHSGFNLRRGYSRRGGES